MIDNRDTRLLELRAEFKKRWFNYEPTHEIKTQIIKEYGQLEYDLLKSFVTEIDD